MGMLSAMVAGMTALFPNEALKQGDPRPPFSFACCFCQEASAMASLAPSTKKLRSACIDCNMRAASVLASCECRVMQVLELHKPQPKQQQQLQPSSVSVMHRPKSTMHAQADTCAGRHMCRLSSRRKTLQKLQPWPLKRSSWRARLKRLLELQLSSARSSVCAQDFCA